MNGQLTTNYHQLGQPESKKVQGNIIKKKITIMTKFKL